MTSVATAEASAPQGWSAQTLRLTLFVVSPLDASAHLGWWQQIVGEIPDDVITRPREGLGRAHGPWNGGVLALAIAPSRIDWLWEPNQAEGAIELPIIGPFSESAAKFQELTAHWLSMAPIAKRLAFGASLVLPVDSRSDGYRRLASMLPSVSLDAENSSDFLYRINRRRPSRFGPADLFLNRMSTWSVLRYQSYSGQIDLGQRTNLGELSSVGQQHACRLDLDINTDPEFSGTLPSDLIPKIYAELISLGMEVSEQGDVP